MSRSDDLLIHRDDIILDFAERCISEMDEDDVRAYAIEQMQQQFDWCGFDDILENIEEAYPEIIEEYLND